MFSEQAIQVLREKAIKLQKLMTELAQEDS